MNFMNNDRFNISSTTHTPSYDILPDLGNATGHRSSTWLDNSVRCHFMNHCRKTHRILKTIPVSNTSNESPFLRNFDHIPQYHNSSLSGGVNSGDSRPPSSLSSISSLSQYPHYSLKDIQRVHEENIILKTKLETLE
jgi:hypothetical protein